MKRQILEKWTMQQNYKITVLSIIKGLYVGPFLIIPTKDKPIKCQLLQVTIFMRGFSSSRSVFVCFCLSRFVARDRNYDWRQRKTQLWRRLLNFRVRMFVKSAVIQFPVLFVVIAHTIAVLCNGIPYLQHLSTLAFPPHLSRLYLRHNWLFANQPAHPQSRRCCVASSTRNLVVAFAFKRLQTPLLS